MFIVVVYITEVFIHFSCSFIAWSGFFRVDAFLGAGLFHFFSRFLDFSFNLQKLSLIFKLFLFTLTLTFSLKPISMGERLLLRRRLTRRFLFNYRRFWIPPSLRNRLKRFLRTFRPLFKVLKLTFLLIKFLLQFFLLFKQWLNKVRQFCHFLIGHLLRLLSLLLLFSRMMLLFILAVALRILWTH